MTFEEAIEKSVAEGAIRYYRISDNLAFVYRFQDDAFQARGLYGNQGEWNLGKRLVSTKNYADTKGWHFVRAIPWQARAIDSEQAKANPGYGIALYLQCYTCKEEKPLQHYSHMSATGNHARDWECDKCFERQLREVALFNAEKTRRAGDNIDKKTLASSPPPEGQI